MSLEIPDQAKTSARKYEENVARIRAILDAREQAKKDPLNRIEAKLDQILNILKRSE